MSVATAWSDDRDSAAAYGRLRDRLSGDPDFLILYYTEDHDPAALRAGLSGLPVASRMLGGSTSRSLMTEEGVFLDVPVIGMMGVRSEGARFGVALCKKSSDSRATAVLAALDDAGRPGEVPDLLILCSTPGGEEEALSGLVDVLGESMPVFGGSTGDNDSAGRWSVFTRDDGGRDALTVAVVFADFTINCVFQGGCVPSRFGGVVTETDGARAILRIDGQPTADVYTAWHEAQTGRPLFRDRTLQQRTALTPLGREVGAVGGFGAYTLSHIWSLRDDGGLELLTDVKPASRCI